MPVVTRGCSKKLEEVRPYTSELEFLNMVRGGRNRTVPFSTQTKTTLPPKANKSQGSRAMGRVRIPRKRNKGIELVDLTEDNEAEESSVKVVKKQLKCAAAGTNYSARQARTDLAKFGKAFNPNAANGVVQKAISIRQDGMKTLKGINDKLQRQYERLKNEDLDLTTVTESEVTLPMSRLVRRFNRMQMESRGATLATSLNKRNEVGEEENSTGILLAGQADNSTESLLEVETDNSTESWFEVEAYNLTESFALLSKKKRKYFSDTDTESVLEKSEAASEASEDEENSGHANPFFNVSLPPIPKSFDFQNIPVRKRIALEPFTRVPAQMSRSLTLSSLLELDYEDEDEDSAPNEHPEGNELSLVDEDYSKHDQVIKTFTKRIATPQFVPRTPERQRTMPSEFLTVYKSHHSRAKIMASPLVHVKDEDLNLELGVSCTSFTVSANNSTIYNVQGRAAAVAVRSPSLCRYPSFMSGTLDDVFSSTAVTMSYYTAADGSIFGVDVDEEG